jgi:hypothetical protein
METHSRTIETTGIISAQHLLTLDEPLQTIKTGSKVRVIIFVPDEEDIDDKLWMKYGYSNDAFAFLKEPEEDVYTIHDGKPFKDEV